MSYKLIEEERYYLEDKTGKATEENVSSQRPSEREYVYRKDNSNMWKLVCIILVLLFVSYMKKEEEERYEPDRIESEVFIPPVEVEEVVVEEVEETKVQV